MTTFLCIRHGKCDPIGKYIAGRIKGIHLNREGQEEVEALADNLFNIRIEKVFSSPLERACETAEIICKKMNLDYEIRHELIEIDYGDWSGKTIEELCRLNSWKQYNQQKSLMHVPNGEMLIEIESRMASFVEEIRRKYEEVVILISHGEPIKCLIAHYAGIPIDLVGRIEIDTASVTTLSLDDYNAQLLCINYKGAIRLV